MSFVTESNLKLNIYLANNLIFSIELVENLKESSSERMFKDLLKYNSPFVIINPTVFPFYFDSL